MSNKFLRIKSALLQNYKDPEEKNFTQPIISEKQLKWTSNTIVEGKCSLHLSDLSMMIATSWMLDVLMDCTQFWCTQLNALTDCTQLDAFMDFTQLDALTDCTRLDAFLNCTQLDDKIIMKSPHSSLQLQLGFLNFCHLIFLSLTLLLR